MSFLQVFVLAVVQGITEFLPISSSGHLVLVPALTGWPDQGLVMDVAVHAGTLLAVCLYFRTEVKGLALAGLGSIGIRPARQAVEGTPYMKLFWAVVIATLPVIIVGFALKESGVVDMMRTMTVIGMTSIVFGLLLWFVDMKQPSDKTLERMAIKPALVIGFMQVLALIPGTSRAGITMTGARMLGFTRTDAARFSMLLSIPAILGSAVLGLKDVIESGDTVLAADALMAGGLACLVALAAIHFLMKWLERASMTIFVVYRVALGLVLLGLVYGGYAA